MSVTELGQNGPVWLGAAAILLVLVLLISAALSRR